MGRRIMGDLLGPSLGDSCALSNFIRPPGELSSRQFAFHEQSHGKAQHGNRILRERDLRPSRSSPLDSAEPTKNCRRCLRRATRPP
jgi:hypothetical protein